jgi:hypothetical protein
MRRVYMKRVVALCMCAACVLSVPAANIPESHAIGRDPLVVACGS